jgi:hypothetical protein
MFDIFEAGYFVDSCKRFLLRGENGELFLRLMGVNIFPEKNGTKVVPVYVALFEVHSAPGQLALDLWFWNKKKFTTIIFQQAYPYLLWKTIHLDQQEGNDES